MLQLGSRVTNVDIDDDDDDDADVDQERRTKEKEEDEKFPHPVSSASRRNFFPHELFLVSDLLLRKSVLEESSV